MTKPKKTMTTIDNTNFHLATQASFEYCAIPTTKPDFVSGSGSAYWYTEEGVIRASDHWGQCSTCKWSLVNAPAGVWFDNAGGRRCETTEFEVAGFCRWEDFSPVNNNSEYGFAGDYLAVFGNIFEAVKQSIGAAKAFGFISNEQYQALYKQVYA